MEQTDRTKPGMNIVTVLEYGMEEYQYLSKHALSLYYFIICQWNKNFWKRPYVAGTRKLAEESNMSQKTIIKVLNELKNRNLIRIEYDGEGRTVINFCTERGDFYGLSCRTEKY